MRVFVTGGAGFVGSHACKALAEAGHTPVVFDNLRTGHRRFVKWGPFEHGDICDVSALNAAMRRHKPDAIMHFAALAYVGESVSEPNLYYRTNAAGSLNLLDAMRANDVPRIVFSSTCATYGSPERLPIVEDSPQSPVNPYGRSKLMVEHILRDACAAYGIGATALRYFNAAGSDPDGMTGEEHDPETHLIPIVLQAALKQRPAVDIFGDDYDTPDGTCIRDYIHVADLASAHVAALPHCEAGRFDAFNLGTGQGVSVRDVAAEVRAVTGRDVPVRIAPRRAGDPASLVADATRAGEHLGWRPRRSNLPTLIADAWEWMTHYRDEAGFARRDSA